MRATLDLALTLNTEWANFYCAMAYPGSPLRPRETEKWALPDDEEGPGWIGYSNMPTNACPADRESHRHPSPGFPRSRISNTSAIHST